MRKSQQNTVPPEFDSLYKPVLKVKQVITNKNKETNIAEVLEFCFTTLLYFYIG